MLIGEVARRSGVSVKTVRYYEGVGLVAPPRRTPAGYRDYGEDVFDRIAFVRSAQAAGFSLAEIRGILACWDRGEAPCGHVAELIERRSAEIDNKLAELQRIRDDLDRLADRARTLDPAQCRPSLGCQIIKTPDPGREPDRVPEWTGSATMDGRKRRRTKTGGAPSLLSILSPVDRPPGPTPDPTPAPVRAPAQARTTPAQARTTPATRPVSTSS